MRLKNKKTGETMEFTALLVVKDIKNDSTAHLEYDSLGDFFAEWEDVPEEPKQGWYINEDNEPQQVGFGDPIDDIEHLKELGLLFDTEEECRRAIKELKAWKRLKDKGFRFEGIKQDYTRFFSQQKPMRIGRKYLQFNKAEDEEWLKENWEDLDLLFGDEE